MPRRHLRSCASQKRQFDSPCCPFFSRPNGVIVATLRYLSRHFRRWIRSILRATITTLVLLLLLLWLGANYEHFQMTQSPDTLSLYNTPEICGMTVTGGEVVLQTMAADSASSDSTLKNDTTIVAHCGECGHCSTPHDILIYDHTKDHDSSSSSGTATLFERTTDCAKHALVWGRRGANKCMMERVGFSSNCNDCWVENIMCDLRKCLYVCIWYGLFSSEPIDGGKGGLNPCTACDERRCGADFVACAGANRRRTGILSDIERDQESEVCTSVEPGWWKNETLQKRWREQQLRKDDESGD